MEQAVIIHIFMSESGVVEFRLTPGVGYIKRWFPRGSVMVVLVVAMRITDTRCR